MDCAKTGNLIRYLRIEKNMTQKQLADLMNISDKTISKWERGLGCPDVSLISELSDILKVSLEDLLNGSLSPDKLTGGNMKNSKYYVCPQCGNITLSSGNASINCCGRKLDECVPQKATDDEKLSVEKIENDWFISSNHVMKKDNFISYLIFATSQSIEIIRQYPEWNLQVRIPYRSHGTLLWYDTGIQKLFYQYI